MNRRWFLKSVIGMGVTAGASAANISSVKERLPQKSREAVLKLSSLEHLVKGTSLRDKVVKLEGESSIRFDGNNYIEADYGSYWILETRSTYISISVCFNSLPRSGQKMFLTKNRVQEIEEDDYSNVPSVAHAKSQVLVSSVPWRPRAVR